MSERDWRLLFQDMSYAASKIENYLTEITYEDFRDNGMIADAVVRNLEIIGEAAGKLPQEIKLQTPNVPWKEIISLRNRIVHAYFSVDLDIIWHIVCHELGQLKQELKKELDQHP